jgi:hypothetical protein
MKSLFAFYCLIMLPWLPVILCIWDPELRDHFGTGIAVYILMYALVYHPAISGLRLLAKHKINRGQYWCNFIPGWNSKYFRSLFLNG